MSDLLPWDAMAQVANNLIDKGDKMMDRLSNFFVWCGTHKTPNRIAVETYISDIQNSDMDPLTKAVLISNAKKTIKEYKNQCDIVTIAKESIDPDAQPEKVDEDWLAQFMDKARLVNNADLQQLWGRILAGECNSPGSVPKTLLHILEQMETDSAMSFMKMANLSIAIENHNHRVDYVPIITKEIGNDFYDEYGVGANSLHDLQTLGLISFDYVIGKTFRFNTTDNISFRYHDRKYDLPATKRIVSMGIVVFSKAGESLCAIVAREKVDGFFEEICIPYWETQEKENDEQLQ